MYGICWAAVVIVSFLVSTFSLQAQEINEDWRWVHFTTESGLPSNQVGQVFETSDSTVWVSTSLGLAWYDGFKWIPIDTAAGSPHNQATGIMGEFNDSLLVLVDAVNKVFLGNKMGFRVLFEDAADEITSIENVGNLQGVRHFFAFFFPEPIL